MKLEKWTLFLFFLVWLSRLSTLKDGPPGACSMFSSCMLTLPAGQSQRSTFRRSSKISQSLGSNWNLNKAHKLYFLVIFVLSGDIQSNPGPVFNWKYPCGKCNCPVKTNQAGIMCEVCYAWHHCKCVCIDDSEYHRLQLSDEAWCCSSCFRTALPFHDSSTLNSTISSTSCSTSDSISSSLASSHGRDCTIVYTNCRSQNGYPSYPCCLLWPRCLRSH